MRLFNWRDRLVFLFLLVGLNRLYGFLPMMTATSQTDSMVLFLKLLAGAGVIFVVLYGAALITVLLGKSWF